MNQIATAGLLVLFPEGPGVYGGGSRWHYRRKARFVPPGGLV